MKRIFLIFLLFFVLNSCGVNLQQDSYNFDNFKETPLWNLAKAVRADNANKVKQILEEGNLEIDFRDPEYKQTLLALAIQNDKRNAFLQLLNEGANPNELVGIPQDSTPFTDGIWNVKDCDLFYVENMLKHGANPNFEIKNPQPEYYFENSFPLLIAVKKNGIYTKDCLELIKLLVDNGADVNCCYKQSNSKICEGVLAESLKSNSMEALKYFVIEKNIAIPDTVIILGGLKKSTEELYSLKEILKSKSYQYEDFEREGKKFDRSQMRKTRDEILEYLDKMEK